MSESANVPVAPPTSPAGRRRNRPSRGRLLRTVVQRHCREELKRLHARAEAEPGEAGRLVDLLYGGAHEGKPADIFKRLRWGGRFVYVDENRQRVEELASAYQPEQGFRLEQPPAACRAGPLGLPMPGLSRRGWFFIARRTHLLPPGEFSDRFTYDVQLMPQPGKAASPARGSTYFVNKQVPDKAHVLGRLVRKFPDVAPRDLRKRAHKLVDHVFPTFLSREAAMLKLLQRDLPVEHRTRVPRVLGVERDPRGFVRRLAMNWLRPAARPIDQLEFARQSAQLLTSLHEQARVLHMDLRLDNFVITDEGVGLVDFGSSVRIGEKLERSPMLQTLFDEMMRTSQIQRVLGRMLERGRITRQAICEARGKVDPAVDTFYLAVQINHPHGYPEDLPEFRQLIRHDPESAQARHLQALTDSVLRPDRADHGEPPTPRELLEGIERIECNMK